MPTSILTTLVTPRPQVDQQLTELERQRPKGQAHGGPRPLIREQVQRSRLMEKVLPRARARQG